MRKGITTITVMAILVSMLLVGFGGTQVAAELGTMQACWRLDTGIGSDAFDSSDALNDGTLSGGKYGNGLEFDGVDDYVIIDNSPSLDITGTSITVEAWVKPLSLKTANFVVTNSAEGGAAVDDKMEFTIHADGTIAWHTSESGVWESLYSASGAVTIDEWTHIAATMDITGKKIYKNGDLIKSGSEYTTLASTSATRDWVIGSDTQGDDWNFDGFMDEVRILNRALTGAEISEDYTCNAPYPSRTGTAAWYYFDESVGTTAYDETTNGNDGSIIGAIWAGPTWTIGKYGNALEFDGVDDYVMVPDSATLDITAKITIEAWFYNTGNTDFQWQRIIHKNYRKNYEMWITNSDRKLQFRISDGIEAHQDTLTSGTTIQFDVWYHVAAVYDGSSMYIYLNGELSNSKSTDVTSLGVTSDPVVIGNVGTDISAFEYNRPFNGIIDEVRIWDGALTACEVELAMQGKLDILPEAGVIVYYNSIHDLVSDDIVTIEILPSDTSVIIDSVSIHRVTPNKKNLVNLDDKMSVTNQGCYSVDITIVDVPAKVKTVHLWITLSTGEHIPVNLHYGH